MPRCADASCVRWRPAFGVWGGVRLNGTWFCSRSCATVAVRRGLESPPAVGESAGALPPLRIGALLRHQGAITQAQLDAALASKRQSGLRLGAELQRLGFVSSATVVRALAAQAGVSYLTTVDPARVRRAPGGLSVDMVRALGLLPFESQDKKLHVICTAPLPRPALRALARLTGWTAEAYLVDDAVWERAFESYAPGDTGAGHQSEVVHDVEAASAHVVAAAAAGRDAVVRYAGCGDFVWVRVEGGAKTQDVLIQDVLIQPSYVEADLQVRLTEETNMPGGHYAALSGMQARLADLDRLASDLANVGTSGYKTERAATVAAERPSFRAALDSAVDVTTGGTRLDFRPGTISTTGRDLDAAIEGAGFFAVATPGGERYTRNGSFVRRGDGVLTTADGLPLVAAGSTSQPPAQIRVGTGQISITEDGSVKAGDVVAGKIKVVSFATESDIERESGTRFRAKTGVTPTAAASRVVGGSLEQSNVTLVDRMVALTEVQRSFEALQRGISVLMNEIDSRAIGELGRR